jgi:hypothetical protein
MFVAVVYKNNEDTAPNSHRDTGGWEAFVADTEEEAVKKALVHARAWESLPRFKEVANSFGPSSVKADGLYGPYDILVGELGKKVKRFQYETEDAPATAWDFA